jgi:hypothetical protein
MLTPTTPSMSLQAVTTCDAQELHMSAEISKEISSVSAATGAPSGASAGDPHANAAATSNKKGAKRTFVIVRLAPKLAVVRTC